MKKFFSKKTIDRYRELLQTHGTPLPDLEYHGYNGAVFINVLDFLSERRGIDLNYRRRQKRSHE